MTHTKSNNRKSNNRTNEANNANALTTNVVKKTKSERLDEVIAKAESILSDPKKYRYHAAAALRIAVCNSKANPAELVETMRPLVNKATALLPAEGKIALAALRADAVPQDVVLACLRTDGAITASPLMRFLASASVEAERARLAGLKAVAAKAARKERKAAKAAEQASEPAKAAPKGAKKQTSKKAAK